MAIQAYFLSRSHRSFSISLRWKTGALTLLLQGAIGIAQLFAEGSSAGHEFLCADPNASKAVHVNADGSIRWEFSSKMCQDVWLLPNGNYLVSHVRGAREVTREKQIVWEYASPEGTEVHSCQPLSNGSVLVCEGGTKAEGDGSPRLVEVAKDGSIQRRVPLKTAGPNPHMQFRSARKTPEGTYLVAQYADRLVREYGAEGKVLREFSTPKGCYAGVRLPNGNTLVSMGDGHRVVEIDSQDKVVWSVEENDLPGNPLRLAAGLQRLPNGNTLIFNWLLHGHAKSQPVLLEVTPDKKVVWQYENHQVFLGAANGYALDVPSQPETGWPAH